MFQMLKVIFIYIARKKAPKKGQFFPKIDAKSGIFKNRQKIVFLNGKIPFFFCKKNIREVCNMCNGSFRKICMKLINILYK
jgi:hypothetical protein